MPLKERRKENNSIIAPCIMRFIESLNMLFSCSDIKSALYMRNNCSEHYIVNFGYKHIVFQFDCGALVCINTMHGGIEDLWFIRVHDSDYTEYIVF